MLPVKRRFPEVPAFGEAVATNLARAMPLMPETPASLPLARRARSDRAENERRRKAGLPVEEEEDPGSANDHLTVSIRGASVPRSLPNCESGHASSAPSVAAAASDPAASTLNNLLLPSQKSGVYGFSQGQILETKSKAIALRLEPLKTGLPEFEKVLGQASQSITIGSARGVADVVVRDEAVSKKHTTLALIGIHGELALAIVDNSTNGTFVNGNRLVARNKRFRIRNGDVILIKDPGLEEDYGWKLDFGNTVSFFSRS
mmetsp:Transcript_103108/g.204775  ORF Transcript_103108/g.204775 Transcript_103108/m.204775 type:complete len:260 (+) Transcript_103108:54-833(+)